MTAPAHTTRQSPGPIGVTFFVPGIAAPGGSKKQVIRGRRRYLVDDAKRNRPWRRDVAWTARAHYDADPMVGPLGLDVVFVLPRPGGHFTRTGGLRASAPAHPIVRPDATKLLRALEDACTGIVWRDDAQIVEQHVQKIYGAEAGARVRVWRVPEDG